MALWRFTMGFRSKGVPATETYYHDASTLVAAGDLATTICRRRNYMLFASTEWVGVRIGLADKPRQAQLYIPGTYALATDGLSLEVPVKGRLAITRNVKDVDQPNSCIQIILRYDDTRSSKRYLAFVPDEVITGEPDSIDLAQNGDFAAAYTAYRTELVTAGWMVKAKANIGDFAPKDVQAWVASDQAPNNMGAVLVLATAPALKVGDKVAVSGTRRKGFDRTSYNGPYRVSAVVDSVPNSTRTVYLGQTGEGEPGSIKVPGTLQKVGAAYFPIQAWSWFRAGTHKRGKSFGAQAGRRPTRRLLA